MVRDEELVIRPIESRDLDRLWELMYKDEAPEFKKWHAPYFEHRAQTYEVYCQNAGEHVGRDDMWVIEVDGTRLWNGFLLL
ncbi:hypothetical protein [Exiguobacterium chiriqhucha]|uniref:hypothetical protein n=1 Tax=Exiguobacterium chiriqhucha TaxID=1385984 RepID=UPI0030B81B7B